MKISNIERFEILSSGVVTRVDIEKILKCSDSKAGTVMTEIRKAMKERKEIIVAKNTVSASAFMAHVGWSMKWVVQMAEEEKRLEICN